MMIGALRVKGVSWARASRQLYTTRCVCQNRLHHSPRSPITKCYRALTTSSSDETIVVNHSKAGSSGASVMDMEKELFSIQRRMNYEYSQGNYVASLQVSDALDELDKTKSLREMTVTR